MVDDRLSINSLFPYIDLLSPVFYFQNFSHYNSADEVCFLCQLFGTATHTILPYTLHCHTHCTATHTALPHTLHCHTHCTATHTALPHTLHCHIHCTATHTALPHTLHCHTHCTATHTALPHTLHCHKAKQLSGQLEIVHGLFRIKDV